MRMFKKITAAFITAALAVCFCANSAFAVEMSSDGDDLEFIPIDGCEIGDVNFDGNVNINDATAIQRYLAKLIEFNDIQIFFADVDGNGRTNINDVTYLQRKIAGYFDEEEKGNDGSVELPIVPVT